MLTNDPRNQLVRPSTNGLVLVQNDATFEIHKRVGRFAIQREAARSFEHLFATIARMQERMIHDLRPRGFEYTGDDFELRGPFEHIEFSEDATTDPGPKAAPDPRDTEKWDAWTRAERARIAKKVGTEDLVDYEIVGKFRVRVAGALRSIA